MIVVVQWILQPSRLKPCHLVRTRGLSPLCGWKSSRRGNLGSSMPQAWPLWSTATARWCFSGRPYGILLIPAQYYATGASSTTGLGNALPCSRSRVLPHPPRVCSPSFFYGAAPGPALFARGPRHRCRRKGSPQSPSSHQDPLPPLSCMREAVVNGCSLVVTSSLTLALGFAAAAPSSPAVTLSKTRAPVNARLHDNAGALTPAAIPTTDRRMEKH